MDSRIITDDDDDMEKQIGRSRKNFGQIKRRSCKSNSFACRHTHSESQHWWVGGRLKVGWGLTHLTVIASSAPFYLCSLSIRSLSFSLSIRHRIPPLFFVHHHHHPSPPTPAPFFPFCVFCFWFFFFRYPTSHLPGVSLRQKPTQVKSNTNEGFHPDPDRSGTAEKALDEI